MRSRYLISLKIFQKKDEYSKRENILSEREQEGPGGIVVVPVEGREGRGQWRAADTVSEPSEMLASDDARARGSQRADVSEDVGHRQRTSHALLEERPIRADGVHQVLAGDCESGRRQSVQGCA